MSSQEHQNWYYTSTNGEQQGPVSIGELSALSDQGILGIKTLVWSQGYPDWFPITEITDLLKQARGAVRPVRPVREIPADHAAAKVEGTASASLSSLDLKPRKGLFVFPGIVLSLILSAMIGGLISLVMLSVEKLPWPGLGVMAAGSIMGVVASLVAYRKESYQIRDNRVICRRGGLVSDQTTELEVRNITHVKIKLPWLRHKFFGVGNVIIETAGTSKPVVLRLIDGPEDVYVGMRERMKMHGYDLTQERLLHEERPALIGIFGECLGLLGGAAAVVSVVFSEAFAEQDKAGTAIADSSLNVALGSTVLISVGLIVSGLVLLRFFDYRRRTYRVYDDVVVYDEGFLTRENAFIPFENIADSNTKSTLFDRIFGLCDVQVSCQGSGSEIKFRRLKQGVRLSAAINQLVIRARQKQEHVARAAAGNGTPDASRGLPRRSEPEAITSGASLAGEYRMHAARTMLPLMLLFPVFPIWIAAMIQAGIRVMSTRYSVRDGSMRHSYRFLTTHDREFACDKITGVMIKQNLWDRLFGTMTLRFWSIGSGKALEFAHVKSGQLDLPALMRQAGIPAASPGPHEVKTGFGALVWLRASLKYLPIPLLAAAAIILAAIEIDQTIYYVLIAPFLACVAAFLRSKIYHARQRLRFHDHHIEAEQGIITRRRYLVRYRNVKRTMITRYPGGEDGRLEIFVAAEEEVLSAAQQKQTRQAALKQVSFTTGFIPNVRDTGLLLDDILCGRVEPAPQATAAEPLAVLLESRRSVGNALVKLVVLSVLLFPLIALLPLTIPAVVIRVKRCRYRIEAARIVMSWGISYRHEMSVLLDRVDSLQQSQGPLNKLFGNGNVSIMTAGSSKPDLHLVDSPAYSGMYETIRERSQ